ncbi:MAG: hypothetical protein JWM34_2160 [Ilumatobacteraceae bacterium]|nr:hypothetical protein [Ilumatobacteraceae bacterium]
MRRTSSTRRTVARRAAALLVVTSLAAACSSSSPGTSATSGSKATSTTTATAASTAATAASTATAATGSSAPATTGTPGPPIDTGAVGKALLASGIGIVPIDALDTKPVGGPFVVTDFQAATWQAQVTNGGGELGTELRTLVNQAPDEVPVDFIVAEWLHEAKTPAAQLAVTMVPIAQLTDPGTFRYPWAVLALFLNDVANSGSAAGAGTPSTATAATSGPARAAHSTSALPNDGVCGLLTSVYDDSVGAVITSLQGSDTYLGQLAGSALDTFVGWLSAAVNTIPVVKAIKISIQMLLLVTSIGEAFQPWDLTMQAVPEINTYGTGIANSGTVTVALARSVATEWPYTITDCARAFGLPPLPSLDPTTPPTPVEMTMTASRADGTPPESSTTTSDTHLMKLLDGTYGASLIYQTGINPSPASDEAATELLTVDATVHQNMDTIHKILQSLVQDAIQEVTKELTSLLPAGGDLLTKAVNYLAGGAAQLISDELAPDSAAVATTTVTVGYYKPKPPDTTAPAATPDTAAPEDQCATGTPLVIVPTSFVNPANESGITLSLSPNGTATLDWDNSAPLVDPSGDNIQLRGQQSGTWTNDGHYHISQLSGTLEAFLEIAGTSSYTDIGQVGSAFPDPGSSTVTSFFPGTGECHGTTLTIDATETTGSGDGVQFSAP